LAFLHNVLVIKSVTGTKANCRNKLTGGNTGIATDSKVAQNGKVLKKIGFINIYYRSKDRII